MDRQPPHPLADAILIAIPDFCVCYHGRKNLNGDKIDVDKFGRPPSYEIFPSILRMLCASSPESVRKCQQPSTGKQEQGTLRGGGGFVWGQFRRGEFRRTSKFGAGQSDTGNFDTPNLWFLVDNHVKLWQASSEIKKRRHLQGRWTSSWHSLRGSSPAGLIRNNTWLPPPLTRHKELEIPQIVQKNSAGKISHQTEKRKFPHEIPPPVCQNFPSFLRSSTKNFRP